MSLYEALLALHIVAAIVWLGAAFVITLLVLRAHQSNDPAGKAAVNAQSDWLAPRLFIPSALGTFLFGLLLVIEGSWDLGTLWIAIGLGGWLASFGTGILYFRTEGEAVNALAEERGADYPEVQRRLDRMEAVGRVELTLLFLIVVDMAVKPTGDDTALLVAGAAVLMIAAALAFRSLPSAPEQAT